MPSIADLIRVVPPPKMPLAASGDWSEVEREMGLVFPNDYKEFIANYGAGAFCSYLLIHSPFLFKVPPWTEIVSPKVGWTWWSGIYSDWDPSSPKLKFGVYPEVPGLLPCGLYGDIDVLGWLTDEQPDKWYVVYFSRQGLFELKGIGFLDFLLGSLEGKIPLPASVFGKEIQKAPRIYKATE
jgi:hypothetical protein